jgi:hypothetical protein
MSDHAWPEDHRPERCPVSSFNELAIVAPAERVWAHLVRATDWPTFYSNARGVEIEGGSQELTAGVTFTQLVRLGLGVGTQSGTIEWSISGLNTSIDCQ